MLIMCWYLRARIAHLIPDPFRCRAHEKHLSCSLVSLAARLQNIYRWFTSFISWFSTLRFHSFQHLKKQHPSNLKEDSILFHLHSICTRQPSDYNKFIKPIRLLIFQICSARPEVVTPTILQHVYVVNCPLGRAGPIVVESASGDRYQVASKSFTLILQLFFCLSSLQDNSANLVSRFRCF